MNSLGALLVGLATAHLAWASGFCDGLLIDLANRYDLDLSSMRREIEAMAKRIAKRDRIPQEQVAPLVDEIVQASVSARRIIDDSAVEGDLLRGIFNGAETMASLRFAARVVRGEGYDDFEVRHFAYRAAYFARRYAEYLHDRATAENPAQQAREAAAGATQRIFDGTMEEDRRLVYDPATGHTRRLPLREESVRRLHDIGLRLAGPEDPIPFNDRRDYPESWIDALDSFECRAARTVCDADPSLRIAGLGRGTRTLFRPGRYQQIRRFDSMPRPGVMEAQYQLEPKACDIVAFRDRPGSPGRRELCLYEIKRAQKIEDETIDYAVGQLRSTVLELTGRDRSLLVGELQFLIHAERRLKLTDYRLSAEPIDAEGQVFALLNRRGRRLGITVNRQWVPLTVRLVSGA